MSFLSYLLPLSVATPLVAIVLMIICRFLGKRFVHSLAMLGFGVPALFAGLLAFYYPSCSLTAGGYAYTGLLPVGLDPWGIYMSFGLNGIALPLFCLAAWVGLAAGLYAMTGANPERTGYLMLLLVMFAGLLGTFASTNLFFFFFFHELALIPTFVMIARWGGQGRRSVAMEITVYLTFGAMLTLTGLIALYHHTYTFIPSFDFYHLSQFFAAVPLSFEQQGLIVALLIVGLGTLVSLFPFHSWAPRGYATAPTSTAMLHAGVLKKFGLYGLVQFIAPLLPLGMEVWSPYLVILALMNVLYIGWVTLSQNQLKMMLGYSSVMHMGYAFLGIATLSTLGMGGAVILMVGHGLTVAVLFLLATTVYRRTQSYDMKQLGGLATHTPILAAFFVAATLASLGLPGFFSFWGELAIFVALWAYSPYVAAGAVAGIVISAVYGLRAAARIFFGPSAQQQPVVDMTWGERWPAILLLAALLIFGFWPKVWVEPIDQALRNMPVQPIYWTAPTTQE